MEIYTTLRHFADSWGLLGMTLFFLGVVLYAFRPAARPINEAAAGIPFRHEDRPARPACAGDGSCGGTCSCPPARSEF